MTGRMRSTFGGVLSLPATSVGATAFFGLATFFGAIAFCGEAAFFGLAIPFGLAAFFPIFYLDTLLIFAS